MWLVSEALGLAIFPAASALRSRCRSGDLSTDLHKLSFRCYDEVLDVRSFAPLLEILISDDLDAGIWDAGIWDAAYSLVSGTMARLAPLYPIPVLGSLREHWTNPYFPDSLDALQSLIRDFESHSRDEDYYARTLVFIQSSGMGKSRLADSFGKTCPMINFTLGERGTRGFPTEDHRIRVFLRSLPPMWYPQIMETGPPGGFLDRWGKEAWKHSVAVGFLQASIEKCELAHFGELCKISADRYACQSKNGWKPNPLPE